MKLDKDEFLKTEFGTGIIYLVDLLDEYHIARSKYAEREDWENFCSCRCQINELDAALQVVKVAIKQFYGIEYEFCQTDDYYGLCTEDGSDWLFKTERED